MSVALHAPSDPLERLNPQQREAVAHGIGPEAADARALLVIAGAGSGKTRTLTWRVARLVAEALNSDDAIDLFSVAAGYAVAGVSIRSSSQVKFPGQLHDIKAAIRWLRANAAKYNLDPNRIAVLGGSAIHFGL